MRRIIITFGMALGAACLASPQPARAIGCISGGTLGAVGGHAAGHGVLGAVGGCVAGHYANKYQKRRAEQQKLRQPPAPPRVDRSGIGDPAQGFGR